MHALGKESNYKHVPKYYLIYEIESFGGLLSDWLQPTRNRSESHVWWVKGRLSGEGYCGLS